MHLFGLSIAICTSTSMYMYVKSETERDKFFTQGDQVYRVIREVKEANDSYKSPTLSAPLNELISIKSGLPLSNIARVYQDDELMSYGDRYFFESNVLYVDEQFLDILDYPFGQGSPDKALSKTNSAIISQKIAKKYFGDFNPIGKIIEIKEKGLVEVTGVLDDSSINSHLSIDFLINNRSMGYASKLLENNDAHVFTYYLKIPEEQFNAVQHNLNKIGELIQNEEGVNNTSLALQPLSEIYFGEPFMFDIARHNDWKTIETILVVALIILVITAANLINLYTAKLSKRIKQIGIKKVLGASKGSMLIDWGLEVYFMTLVATALGLILCLTILPVLDNQYGFNFDEIKITTIIVIALLVPILLTIIIAGISSIFISTIKPFGTLSGQIAGVKVNLWQHLVLGIQFAVAFVMIVLSIVISKQSEFMFSRELGLDDKGIIVFDSNNRDSWKNRSFIAEEIKSINGVVDVSMTYGGLPDSPIEQSSFEINDIKYQWSTSFAESNFTELLSIEIIDGQNFGNASSKTSVLLNETAARTLGWPKNEVIGIPISLLESNEEKTIVGIVNDYHFQSFRNKIEPLVIQNTGWEESFVVKLSSNNYKSTLTKIEKIWNEYVPHYPFSYRFLEDSFRKMHLADMKGKKLLLLFTLIAFMITSLGTISLMALVQESKTKEVTIRKFLGAPITDIFYILTSEFLKMLVYSCFLALPFSWLTSNYWLNDFSYKIDLGSHLFILGFLLLLSAVMIMVVIKSWKTALLNPVIGLKESI